LTERSTYIALHIVPRMNPRNNMYYHPARSSKMDFLLLSYEVFKLLSF
jgi:hypothetical protein